MLRHSHKSETPGAEKVIKNVYLLYRHSISRMLRHSHKSETPGAEKVKIIKNIYIYRHSISRMLRHSHKSETRC
jgi:hypothetical protein